MTVRETLAHRGADWLTRSEAAQHAAVMTHTIEAWREHGLFPNPRRATVTRFLYLRADVDRILAAPADNGRGHYRAVVRAQIAANGGV